MSNKMSPIVLLAALLTSCGSSTDQPATPAPLTATEAKSPAGPGSAQPDLAAGSDGRVFLSWLEPDPSGPYLLRFSIRDGQEWSAPKTIAQGTNWFVSHVDFPLLTILSDGSLAANWLVATAGPASEAYDISLVFSNDDGNTWSPPIAPHRDRSKRQHGFPSFVPTADGKLAAIWLDGRNMPGELEGDMALMYTTVAPDGSMEPEVVLDNRTCECCQTAMTAIPDGLVAVYRDRSENEIRDISIVRFTDGSWSEPAPLSKDGWEIDGCPVNGPAISSNGTNVAVAWLTAVEDKAKIYALISGDSGVTFGEKIHLDGGNPAGRVDVVSLPSGDTMVSWIERTADGPQVHLRQIARSGIAGPVVHVSGTHAPLSSGVPRMVVSGDELVIAWTDATEQVRTAVVRLKN